MKDGEKIVNFEWCKKCTHFSKSESEDPCWECLDQPINTWSHRPVYFEEDKNIKKNDSRKKQHL